jgi:hypothetical protein
MSAMLWKRIQQFLGITADGIPGNQTARAVASGLGIDSAAPADIPSGATIDPRSTANIATLRPEVRMKAREWLLKCLGAGINVKQADVGPRVTRPGIGHLRPRCAASFGIQCRLFLIGAGFAATQRREDGDRSADEEAEHATLRHRLEALRGVG